MKPYIRPNPDQAPVTFTAPCPCGALAEWTTVDMEKVDEWGRGSGVAPPLTTIDCTNC